MSARTGEARSSRKVFAIAAIASLMTCALTGCPERRGPAQKAGEKIDRATDKISDALDPKGPAEKAGRKIDRALDK